MDCSNLRIFLQKYSLAGVLDSVKISGGNEPSSSKKDMHKGSKTPTRSAQASQANSLLASPTQPIAIDGHDSAGKGAAKSKARKRTSKPAFPAPSMVMVKQAFDMLDPTGSGAVNPYALRDVGLPTYLSNGL